MNDRGLTSMQVVEGIGDGFSPPQYLVDCGGLPGDTGAQIGSFNIIHHQILAILKDEVICDPWQVVVA